MLYVDTSLTIVELYNVAYTYDFLEGTEYVTACAACENEFLAQVISFAFASATGMGAYTVTIHRHLHIDA